MRLVLASASPRRADLLRSAGYQFTVEPADVDESVQVGETPEGYVGRVALAKANRALASRSVRPGDIGREGEGCRKTGSIILAADTAVVLDSEVVGKAESNEDAIRMLKRLSGVTHDVLTGVVVIAGNERLVEVARTRVHLLPISESDIQWYVGTGEPLGKAGGYAIQGRAARFVDWIEGSWSNVVGLPLATVHLMLRRLGVVF
jgi:nucleoside triphosphate pyrophosphatase